MKALTQEQKAEIELLEAVVDKMHKQVHHLYYYGGDLLLPCFTDEYEKNINSIKINADSIKQIVGRLPEKV